MKIKNFLIMFIMIFISITIFTGLEICSYAVSENSKTTVENNSLYSEIVLPPGSTSADLQEAINNAVSGDIIIISSDMEFTTIVTIPAEKEITIRVRYRKFLGINDDCYYKTL